MKSARAIELENLQTKVTRIERQVHEGVARTKDDAGLELDAKVVEYMESHKNISYGDALTAVAAENPVLVAETFGDDEAMSKDEREAGKEFGRLVAKRMKEKYEGDPDGENKAMAEIRDENPELITRLKKVKDKPKAGSKEASLHVFDDLVVGEDPVASAGALVDKLAQGVLREHPDWPYSKAMNQVLEMHPDLARRYAGFPV